MDQNISVDSLEGSPLQSAQQRDKESGDVVISDDVISAESVVASALEALASRAEQEPAGTKQQEHKPEEEDVMRKVEDDDELENLKEPMPLQSESPKREIEQPQREQEQEEKDVMRKDVDDEDEEPEHLIDSMPTPPSPPVSPKRETEKVQYELQELEEQQQLLPKHEPKEEDVMSKEDDEPEPLIEPIPSPPLSPKRDTEQLQQEKRHEDSEKGMDDEHLIDIKEEVDPLKSEVAEDSEMEFSKNYSDDLMGQSDGRQQQTTPLAADLADFEMPIQSGTSNSDTARQQYEHQTMGRKSSSRSTSTSSSVAQPPPPPPPSSSHQSYKAAPATISSAPNLSAVKDLLASSYSRVSHVFQWERPLETGIIFGIGLTIITTLTFFSIISVFAYSALGVILTSALIRLHKTICKTLNRPTQTRFDHIWDKALSLNVSLSPEKMHQLVDSSLSNLNTTLIYLKQVLLFEDKCATLKFGVFLYVLTYVGAWFNGMTLITISYLALFSVPILYQKNKTNIDQYLKLANGHISSTLSMVTNRASSLVSNQSSTHQD